MAICNPTVVVLAASATVALVHTMEQSEASVKPFESPMDWFNGTHATLGDALVEDTPFKTALDLVHLKETLESWGFSENALLDMVMPNEDKVTSVIEAAEMDWADSDATGLTEEKKREMIALLEKARGLGVEQVEVFRDMVTVKNAIEKLGGDSGEEIEALRKELFLRKQRFLQLQREEAEVFRRHAKETNLYFPGSIDPLFDIETPNGKAALSRRSAAILQRFEYR